MICYHTTDAADAILSEGFRDATGIYPPFDHEVTGVFLCDRRVDANEGAKGNQVLRVEFGDDFDIGQYEHGVGSPPTWCVPAAEINEHATVTLITV